MITNKSINHDPIFDTAKVGAHYSEKDGVEVKYVCTSAMTEHGASAADIFYRETPHPEFGNRYFGLYNANNYGGVRGGLMICNADQIENLTFNMVEVNDQWHYSQHRHDFYSVGDVTIDGGRAYLRLMGNINAPRATMRVWNGEFVMVPQFKEGMADETF